MEGFSNAKVKEVHDDACEFMDKTPVNLHENAPGFEEARNILHSVLFSKSPMLQEYLKNKLHKHKIQAVTFIPQFDGSAIQFIYRISYVCCLPRLDPRQFGHPNHRERTWRVVFNSRRKTWSSPYTLSQLADMILAPRNCKLALSAKAYCVATRSELQGFPVREGELTRQQPQTLGTSFLKDT